MACAKHSLKKPAAGEQLGQSGSQNVLRTLKSMAKDGREFPLEKYQKTCRSWSSKRDFAHRMELDPELSFLSAEETAYLESKLTKESVFGWFYLWDIAKINGCEWKPQDSVQKKWLKTLTADSAVQESDDPHLRNEGHVQYFYVEEMGGETHRRARAEDEVVQESGGAEHQRIRRGRSCEAIKLALLSLPPRQPLDLASAHGWCATDFITCTIWNLNLA